MWGVLAAYTDELNFLKFFFVNLSFCYRGLSQELTKVVEKLFFSSQGKIHKGGQRTRDKFALR